MFKDLGDFDKKFKSHFDDFDKNFKKTRNTMFGMMIGRLFLSLIFWLGLIGGVIWLLHYYHVF